jgi:hypothetical protein
MVEFTKELFLHALADWGSYRRVFRSLPVAEQAEFLKTQGYASLHDLLAHVAGWWEEARGIIRETIKREERSSRKYDFDEFNAASLKRFKDMPEGKFMAWYESELQQMTTLVSGLTPEQMHVPRIQSWLDGVILEHLKEHGVDAPRYLVIDMLQREWGGYLGRFHSLSTKEQAGLLEKQGFKRFRDLAAHIIAWWEQGIHVVEGSSTDDPIDVEDVDAFNAEAVERFGKLEEPQVFSTYDSMRLTLANLVDMLPDEVLSKPNVRSWLRADVIDHYYEHAV